MPLQPRPSLRRLVPRLPRMTRCARCHAARRATWQQHTRETQQRTLPRKRRLPTSQLASVISWHLGRRTTQAQRPGDTRATRISNAVPEPGSLQRMLCLTQRAQRAQRRKGWKQESLFQCTRPRQSELKPRRHFPLGNNLCGLRVLCVRLLRAIGAARAAERTVSCLFDKQECFHLRVSNRNERRLCRHT